MKTFTHGFYRHFKGGTYSTTFIAYDEATREPLVVYRGTETGTNWTRPVRTWTEIVLWPDGVLRPRYDLIEAYSLDASQAYEEVAGAPGPSGGPQDTAEGFLPQRGAPQQEGS
jgi:hypothetical protein